MPPIPDLSFRTHPEVLVTELTDRDGLPEAVLLHLGTQKYFSLNDSGLRIWNTLERGQPLSAAVADLTAAFAVSPDQAEASARRLVEELSAAGLIAPAASN